MTGTIRWPSNKRVAFAIRDDDISYFTQPWMLDTIYREAWRLEFKVSLAVVPNIRAQPVHDPSGIKNFPISENRELVDYLLEKIAHKNVDIIQHGYTHAREGGEHEFAVNDFELVNKKVREGNKLLCEAFKRDVTVFTTPHERISQATWKSLDQNEMCLCRKFTLGRFLMTAPFSSMNFRKIVQTIIRHPNPLKLIPNSIIDLADTAVIQWDILFSSSEDPETQLEKAKRAFLRRLSKGEAFVMLHHHWDYFYDQRSKRIKQDLFACFNSFLNFVSLNNSVWKTTLSELYSWIKRSTISS